MRSRSAFEAAKKSSPAGDNGHCSKRDFLPNKHAMIPILERFIHVAAPFRPRSPADVFALRLAHKLGDAAAAQHYAMLVASHSESHLLVAFRRTVKSGQHSSLGRRFHMELERAHSDGQNGDATKLLAVRVERRSVAAAIFHGGQLEYTQVRQLSSSREKALTSAVGFINWIGSCFELESAALEAIDIGEEFHRRALYEAVQQALRDQALPIWTIPKQDLLAAYGSPALKGRKEIREVIATIWPVLAEANAKVLIQDAAALGLYVQIERQFLINESSS